MAASSLRFGVIGLTSDHVWGMGEGLAALPGVDLVAAADGHPELREEAMRRWRVPTTYEHHRELLERERPDAVLICCDNAAKAEVVADAAGRGVHVYQDKPLAATAEQAEGIARAVEDAGIRFMVAYHRAFSPHYEELRRVVRDGALGQVFLARGAIGHGGPVEFGCSRYFCEWLFDPARNGGGALVDEGCYVVDTMVDYVGPIVEVSAFTTQMGTRDYLPAGIEDNAVVILRFASGALGVIDAKWGQVGPAPLVASYHGTEGTLSVFSDRAELHTRKGAVREGWEPLPVAAAHGPAQDVRGWRLPTPPRSEAGRGGTEQRAFVALLRDGVPLPDAAGLAVGLHTQRVIDAAYRSAESGRAARVDQGGDGR
ncbi:MAG TPA: Gfo/Idh/MocA family oxidoreductase [Candidatus Dormibacteraeota bacterium]|jgi:predicted dehydrogenase|nr:Gfo/Idh/MocA family oxidoreductase [Candidatus Dormibacteraeota bacterium]